MSNLIVIEMAAALWPLLLGAGVAAATGHATMHTIPAGDYQAFIMESSARGKPVAPVVVPVGQFEADDLPVTNEEFLTFVKSNFKWQRGNASPTFVDKGYLSHWREDLNVGTRELMAAPAAHVSWFAARAYCQSKGKRLPSISEWEYMARPEAFGKDWVNVQARILEWYASPGSEIRVMPAMKDLFCTKDGVCGLHGVAWEWVEDFGSIIATEEGRGGSSPGDGLFCGAGALGATDPTNYMAFMRYAFRSSLKGAYTIGHLGFRCVR